MIYRLLVPPDLSAQPQDEIWVETREGEVLARVVFMSQSCIRACHHPYSGPILRYLRHMTQEDQELMAIRSERERQAKLFCKELIAELGLSMKLSRVSYLNDEAKAIFFFTAANRVDFRELVRRLARRLRIRVEMRQIGVRDETRLLGGLGPCGHPFCCEQFLRRFRPVSVRMAKNQDLSLNPDAISGMCGRLMCCLGYENENYHALRAALPRPNAHGWMTDGRPAVVSSVHVLRSNLTVTLPDGERCLCPASQWSATPPEGVTVPIMPAGEPPSAWVAGVGGTIPSPDARSEKEAPAPSESPASAIPKRDKKVWTKKFKGGAGGKGRPSVVHKASDSKEAKGSFKEGQADVPASVVPPVVEVRLPDRPESPVPEVHKAKHHKKERGNPGDHPDTVIRHHPKSEGHAKHVATGKKSATKKGRRRRQRGASAHDSPSVPGGGRSSMPKP
jgi:cell fate regulator YaaT (PSP1 superfamily)